MDRQGSGASTPLQETAHAHQDFTAAVARAANGGALRRLIGTLLEALAKAGRFDAAFISVVDRERSILRVDFTSTTGPEGLVPVGTNVPLPSDFPERAYLGVTRSVEDPQPDPDSRIAQSLGLRTYASVPVITADYRLFGMLCGASREPHEVTDDTVAVMEYFARLLVDQMARDAARSADRRARSAERRLSERMDFLAQAEHMLKTPLSVIGGWVEQLRAGTVPEADVPTVLATLSERVADLTTQVGRLLDEVASDVRTRHPSIEVRDLDEEVNALVRAFNGAAGAQRVVVHSGEHVVSPVDPALLAQVIAHLLDNSVKYSQPGTEIEVTVHRSGGRAHIVVTDQGVGLPEGVDIFAAFQRAPDGRAESATAGVGLGLHIVRNLLRAMRGEIVAEPRPNGATFIVTLPLAGTTDADPTAPGHGVDPDPGAAPT